MMEISLLERTSNPYRVFIITFDAKTNSWDQDDKFLWSLLEFLIERDKQNWPEHIPSNPNEPNWSFCFQGIQYFINLNSKNNRKSRSLTKNLSLIIQRRDTFDNFADARTRKQIRDRVTSYDQQPFCEYLGSYQDEKSHEWKQYHLPETNVKQADICPLKVSS